MRVVCQRPDCRMAGNSMPLAIISWTGPTRVLCPARASTMSSGSSGVSRHPLVDARHLARVELLADRARLAHGAEHPPVVDAAPFEPRLDELHGVARQIERRASPVRVGLARAHQHRGRAVDFLQYIRHFQRHELGAPQQRVVAQCQAARGSGRRSAGLRPPSCRFRSGQVSPWTRLPAPPAPVHPLQGEPDSGAAQRIRRAGAPCAGWRCWRRSGAPSRRGLDA